MNTPNLCPQCGKPNTECNCQSAWANSINETVSASQPIDKPYREQYATHPASGVISTPGKFEGERIYVPFYYEQWGNGCATAEHTNEDGNAVAFFAILEDERQAFRELGGAYGLALEETEQGFVHATLYESQQAFDGAVYDAENPEVDPYEFGLRDMDDEPSEPEEGDITTRDHQHFYQHGKLVLTVPEDGDYVAELKAYMDREQFWPNCWFISDHGNTHPLDLTKGGR